jgi:hypothetical protein
VSLEETLLEVQAQIDRLDREFGLPLQSIRAGDKVMDGIKSAMVPRTRYEALAFSVLVPYVRGIPVTSDQTLQADEFALVYRARGVK